MNEHSKDSDLEIEDGDSIETRGVLTVRKMIRASQTEAIAIKAWSRGDEQRMRTRQGTLSRFGTIANCNQQLGFGKGSFTYGEVTQGSFEKILQRLESEGVGIEERSVFLDVGSGVGNVCLQVAIEKSGCIVGGYEALKVRHEAALELVRTLEAKFVDSNGALQRTFLENIDIGKCRRLAVNGVEATHVFSFNKYMHPDHKKALERLVLRT